jgi:hypothetical protein
MRNSAKREILKKKSNRNLRNENVKKSNKNLNGKHQQANRPAKKQKKRISWIENHAEKLLPSKSNIEKIANMSTTPGPL